MPAVFVRYDPELVERDREGFYGLTYKLCAIVAEALDVPENPEGRLTANDVEVFADPIGEFDQVGSYFLCITIFCNDYPERVANLEQRRSQIQEQLSEYMKDFGFGGKGDVYIIPGPNCWGEFPIRAVVGGQPTFVPAQAVS